MHACICCILADLTNVGVMESLHDPYFSEQLQEKRERKQEREGGVILQWLSIKNGILILFPEYIDILIIINMKP